MNICQRFRYGMIMFNALDQFVGQSIKEYGEYSPGESRLFEQIVHPGSVVVEAGANIGSLTIHLAQLAGETGHVYAFEPQRLVFQLLAGNIALNSLSNVHCFQYCVGSTGGYVSVPVLDPNQVQNWGGVPLLDEHWDKAEPVEVVTLDSMNLPKVDFIKIDVEGMEVDVLKGAEEIVGKDRPLIYAELNHEQEKREELLAWMKEHNYKVYPHNPPFFEKDNFFHSPRDIFEMKDADGRRIRMVSTNALCVPEEKNIRVQGSVLE